jgi:dihydroorotate dehydrogenase electron transfer subunit
MDEKIRQPLMAKIVKVVQETPSHSTYFINKPIDALPGQFAMLWLPGIDEKPFSFSYAGKETAFTIQCKGKFTEKICSLREGASVGVRGPFGKGFDFKGVKKAVVVAGGCGSAPLATLLEALKKNGAQTKIVLGAKTKTELLFEKRFAALGEIYITTDDGTAGRKGFTTDVLKELLAAEKPDCVFSVGPEPMMTRVFAICEESGVRCQLSLERFMRCGFGLCGACACGAFLVCKDGPVFSSEQLRKMPDFGKSALLKSGRKVTLKEYADWRQC